MSVLDEENRKFIDDSMTSIQRGLEHLNTYIEVEGSQFLTGDSETIADIFIFSQLTDMLALRRSFNQYPQVTQFYSVMSQQHSIQEVFGEESAWRLQVLPRFARTLDITGLADYEDNFAQAESPAKYRQSELDRMNFQAENLKKTVDKL